jgi:hypothetical protein
MALSSSDVYSPQTPGLATVLGSGLGPLHIIQQEAARVQRERQAAARLKQQQEAADARNVVPIDANGWLPHNEELRALTEAAYQKQLAIYGDPTKSAFQKKAEALQEASRVKQLADRSNELNARYKTTIGLASDPRYDKAALETGAYSTFFQTDPTTGEKKAVPLSKYDPSALDNAAVNPAYFNRDKVLQTFIKAEADKESVRLSKAAPLGGYGVNRQASSDIFDVNPDGTLAINKDGSYKIRDINALVQRAHSDPFMAAILRDNAQKAQQGAGADVMANYGELSAEQRATLNGLPTAPTAERIDLATMLAGYGKVKSSEQQTYRAPWRPRADAKQKNPPIYSAPVEADYVAPGQVENPGTQDGAAPLPFTANPTGSDTFATLQAAQVPKGPQQVLATSKYSVPAPVHATASGQNKPYQTDINGVSFRQALVQGEDGKYHWRTNIDKPTVGSFGDAVALPVNKATGVPLTPADGAAYEAAVRDPQNEVRSFVQVITPKNKNFAAEYNQRLRELTAERDRQVAEGDEGAKRMTNATLQDKAREEATGTTTISYVPNYGQDARTLDGLTQSGPKGNYRAHREGVAGHQQRVRAAPAKQSARPSFLKTKTTGSAPAQPAARKTGGMFD